MASLVVKGLNIDTLHTLTHTHIYQGRREGGFQGFLETLLNSSVLWICIKS